MTVITDYIEKLPDAEQACFFRLRELVYKLVPETEDAFSYGIPTFRYKGKYLLGFASNKRFLSLYPGSYVIETEKEALAEFIKSKGTLSFTPEKPIPDSLLRKVISDCKNAIDHKVS